MKKISYVLTTTLLCIGFTALAQTAGDDVKRAGGDVKDATKASGKAVVKTTKTAGSKVKGGATATGHDMKTATKKAGSKVKSGTHTAAAKVEDKTQ